ncbi:ribonuclease Y [Fructilactobacillus fructivorans]|uniref:ribonuclease Y n=1 Tax=Fructilactobacillus fructivorans TaxID=1614 RepID=UPI0007049359|nr:ribonuclease Y [Fructilactobacillus fructivorans]
MITSIVVIIAVLGGAGVGYYIRRNHVYKGLATARNAADKIKDDNQVKIDDTKRKLESKSKASAEQYRKEEEGELNAQVKENQSRTVRVDHREKSLETSIARLDKSEAALATKKNNNGLLVENLKKARNDVVKLEEQRRQVIHERGELTEDQAKQLVLASLEADLKRDFDTTVKENNDLVTLNAAKQAQNLMIEAVQSGPIDVPRDHIERSVIIPDAGMRAKIAGKDDQRLRLIETLTGVDLIFDPENPETLIISTNDPVRREITRNSINDLLAIKQVNNGVIENEVNQTQQDVLDELRKTGEMTVSHLHLGWVHPDLMKTVGRLKFRTSYGQSVLEHSIEVAELSAVMAAELGLDVRMAKRAGLFHDIGKAIDREVAETHVELGVKLTEAYDEDPIVINSIASHHGDVEPDNPYAVLVAVADGMSGARPGARSESVEEYINRLKSLEKIANEHPGVKDSYAIQAGREIRIMVDPKKVDDAGSDELTNEVKDQIEDELTYPGKIKVTTIRQLQAVQYVGGKPKNNKKKKAG